MPGRLPRKVLHVMNAAGGGAALSTLGLIRELGIRGVASSIVCDEAGTSEEREALADATNGETMFTPLYWWNRKIRAALWKRPAIEARQLLRTRARIGAVGHVVRGVRLWGAELIHTNTFLTPDGGRAARLLGIGHVWHLRELIGPQHPFQLPLEGKALGSYLMAHASVVVANSHVSGAAVSHLLDSDRFAVIPNGIELESFARIDRRPTLDLAVGMVANLTSRTKNHLLFIDAAKRVPRARFRLYGLVPESGRDAYADEVRARCREGGVDVMGFVPVHNVMAAIDVLVHTADNESFGRTVVEAMASGLPVVGVAAGGVGETVLHDVTGLLAAPGSAEGLANHINRLIDDPSLRIRLGQAGRLRAIEQYSLGTCADRLGVVYQRALAAPVASSWTVLSLLGALP